jgi:arylsulfate sulfotransferase
MKNLFSANNTFFNFIIIIALSTVMLSCDSGPGQLDEILKGSMNIKVNPYEKVPLGGLLTFRTDEACKVEIEVAGRNPISKEFSAYETSHSIPVLGLYADTINNVKVKLTTDAGKEYIGDVQLKTEALPYFFPTVEIKKIDRTQMEPGLHLIEMLIANNGKFLSYTIMFDDNGDIRWFMDMSSAGQITYSGLRMSNGNWLYLSWIDLWELDDLGKVIKNDKMWLYAGNHHISELEDGKILMGGSKKDAMVTRKDGYETITRYDYVVEWDRKANKGTKEWDLAQVLDINRSVFPPDYSLDTRIDWFHLNSVALNPKDNSVLASGRNQGVVKVDNDNNLKWILAPHRGWGKSGRTGEGFNTSDFLLTAVDSNEEAYPDAVQEGIQPMEEFEWSTGQHALNILENGNLLLFDNGLSRNFKGKPTYSRAVEYKIDEENMSIQQVWQYGKKRGLDMYSPITSDIDILPNTQNRLITVGNIRAGSALPHSKLIEITYPDNKEVFEAHILFKDAKGSGERSWAQFDIVFKGERYPLYKD